MTSRLAAALACAAILLTTAAPASAQVLGVFTWQMQPYCNKVAVTLTAVATGYTLHGFDDQCGADTKASVVGVAVINPNGTAGVNFTILRPGGARAQVSGVVSPATGQGTWSDDLGNSGTFALGGAATGLPARPWSPVVTSIAESLRPTTDPCDGQASAPTLRFCGSNTAYWRSDGFGVPGIQVWKDAQNRVHIRGSANRSGGGISSTIFVLPAGMRPKQLLGLPVVTGYNAGVHASGAALLVIYPEGFQNIPGFVSIYSPSVGTHEVVHLGEIVFSLDQ